MLQVSTTIKHKNDAPRAPTGAPRQGISLEFTGFPGSGKRRYNN